MKSIRTSLGLWQYSLVPLFLIGSLIATYYTSLQYAFQFDDVANITKHFNIRHYSLSQLFFSGTRWISYWLNSVHYSIGKFDPLSYRIGNLIIHGISGILIFFILLIALSRLKKESFFTAHAFLLACITSLLFLLHPVQTQTVSYVIQGQLEGMAMLATLLMIFGFLLATITHNSFARAGLLVGVCITALLACGTKEIAMVSPILLLIFDWFFIAQGDIAQLKQRTLWHLAVVTIVWTGYLYLLKPTFFADIFGMRMELRNNIGNIITPRVTDKITPFNYCISQFKVILHYLSIFIWPFSICVEYDWKICAGFFTLDCLVPLSILLSIAGYVVSLLRTHSSSLYTFGLIWFMAAILPRSSIVPSCELIVDYKTYLGSFGIFFMLAIVIVKLLDYSTKRYEKGAHISHATLVFLLATGLGAATAHRNMVWESGTAFWGNIIKNAPGKARAYNNYGVELSQNLGKYTESISYFQKAIDMDPIYPDPHNNIAVAYAATGKIDDGIKALQQALRINPYHPEGYNNLASFLIQKQEYAQAEHALHNALKLRPHYGKAFFNLGRIYLEQGLQERAWEHFKKCCTQADLDNDLGFNAYGQASILVKKYDEAIFAYRKAIEVNSGSVESYFGLGNAYYLSHQYTQAIQVYEHIVHSHPQEMRAWYNLAESYFNTQNYEKALIAYGKIPPAQRPAQGYIRIAECHKGLGNKPVAQQLLTQLIAQPTCPDQVKDVAKTVLAHL
jgi:tetratricopeptide (TPR) repeat protein